MAKKDAKKRKAVSPIVAALILILIVAAAGALMFGIVQPNQSPPSLSVTATGDWLYGNVAELRLVVTNQGGKTAIIENVIITDPTSGVSVDILAPQNVPGGTDANIAVPPNGQVVIVLGLNGTEVTQGKRISGEIEALDPDTNEVIKARFSAILQ